MKSNKFHFYYSIQNKNIENFSIYFKYDCEGGMKGEPQNNKYRC